MNSEPAPHSALVRYWLPPFAWAVIIFSFSCIPNPPLPGTPGSHTDKVAHLVAYAILGGLLFRAFATGEKLRIGQCVLLTIFFTTAYGMSDEIHQLFAGRDCELGDLIADFLGATLASVLLAVWSRRSLKTTP